MATSEFQSTGPVWDPTSPRCFTALPPSISIHGSRVGPDGRISHRGVERLAFQSTGPVWDPTEQYFWITVDGVISIHGSRVGPDAAVEPARHENVISIHGSRVGPDGLRKISGKGRNYFNPRVPCGTRLAALYARA